MDRSVEEYQKDLLWQTALETFYRVAYAESLMSSVLQKWRPIDSVVKSIVTITTIASVMVGWMAWGSPSRQSRMVDDSRECCIIRIAACHP